MKKKLAVFYLLLILSQIGNAQRFGVEGGLNISKPSGLISSSTSLVGIHFGPIIEFSLFEKSFIKSGFLYSEKGYKINFSDILNNPDPDPVFENPGTIKFRTGYIEIPVMMAHKLPLEEEGCSLYLQGGPAISYCCTHKEYVEINSIMVLFLELGLKGRV